MCDSVSKRVTRKTWKLVGIFVVPMVLVLLSLAGLAEETIETGRPSTARGERWAKPQLHEEMKKLEVFDFREKGLLEKLAQLEQEINSKREEIKNIQKNISVLENKSKKLARALSELQSQKMELERRLSERLVYLYKYARRGYMRALSTAKDLDEFRRRTKYLGRIMAEDRRLLEKIFTQEYDVNKKFEKVKQDLSKTDAIVRKEQSGLAALKAEVEKKVIQLMRIHEEKEFYKTALRELESVGSRLDKSIVEVEDRKDSGPIEITNISTLRGKLQVPLLGTVVRGKRLFRSKRVHLSKGIFIRAKEGDQVRAILPGRVEFSGRLKGYGQVIIINHGSRFFSISALLSKREKYEGDIVKQGDVIGEVGSVRNGIGPCLYFEIRKGGKNLDPLRWLKIRG